MFDRRDWETVADPCGGTPRMAELDKFVTRLLDKNLIVEEHKHDAIQQFRLAVMNAALVARLADLNEQESAEGIISAKRTQVEIKTLLNGLRKLDLIDRETPQKHKTQAELALMALSDELEPRACLDIHNRRHADIFKTALIENLIFDWEQLTVATRQKADFGGFVNAAFTFCEIESPDVARYVRDVLNRRKDFKTF
jgi:hypothetical protein